MANGPASFAGRKLGVLVTTGSDAGLIEALRQAAADEGASVELVAPAVAGIFASDGTAIEVGQQFDGSPSVLFDAVALLPSKAGAASLARAPAARDFVADAWAHGKYIGYAPDAGPLLDAAGLDGPDAGVIELDGQSDPAAFIAACRGLRYWPRELDR